MHIVLNTEVTGPRRVGSASLQNASVCKQTSRIPWIHPNSIGMNLTGRGTTLNMQCLSGIKGTYITFSYCSMTIHSPCLSRSTDDLLILVHAPKPSHPLIYQGSGENIHNSLNTRLAWSCFYLGSTYISSSLQVTNRIIVMRSLDPCCTCSSEEQLGILFQVRSDHQPCLGLQAFIRLYGRSVGIVRVIGR